MTRNRQAPFWNVASALLQGFALVAAYGAIRITEHDPKSYYGLIYAVPTYASFSFCGVLAALRALARSERWRPLSWIALVANGIPFVWMLGIIIQKVG
jgi:hypothetical protein